MNKKFRKIIIVLVVIFFSINVYAGENTLITLKFKNANIRTVLNLISAKSGVNIVAGPAVNANINVSLDNVPWEKALDTILKTYRFGYEREGNIIRVMSLDSLTQESLKTRIFSLAYARAEELVDSIKQMLSENGKVSASTMSNSLIVTDIPSNLSKIQAIAEELDEKQRLIEEIKEKERKEEVKRLKSQSGKIRNITLKYDNADLRTVLNDIAYKTQINIVLAKDVEGTVNMNLVEVPWWNALDSIFKTYSLGYEPEQVKLENLAPGDIISVSSLANLASKKALERKLDEVQDLVTKVFELKYLDASVVKDAIMGSAKSGGDGEEKHSLLSARGTIIVIAKTVTPGWEFATSKVEAARARTTTEAILKPSRYLAVIDIPTVMKKIEEFIHLIDKQPEQILIEGRIMEVNVNDGLWYGVQWKSLGQEAGHENRAQAGGSYDGTSLTDRAWTVGQGHNEVSADTTFGASNLEAFTDASATAFRFLYQKLSDAQIQVYLNALASKGGTNILSAPRILTTDGHEAAILVGTKYPVVRITVTATGTTESVEYMNVGIQLYVIPKVIPGGKLNLIVHPVISEFNAYVGSNPIIDTREADTSVIIKSGETIVIGGMLKDKTIEAEHKVPILGDIPLLGFLFKSVGETVEKVELLCFVKGTILDDSNESIKLGNLNLTEDQLNLLDASKENEYPKRDRFKGYTKSQQRKKREALEKERAERKSARIERKNKLRKKKSEEKSNTVTRVKDRMHRKSGIRDIKKTTKKAKKQNNKEEKKETEKEIKTKVIDQVITKEPQPIIKKEITVTN